MPATVVDSFIFKDIFSTSAMRQIFSDEARLQYYLDVEAALARSQAKLNIIPKEACDEIVKHCSVQYFDLEALKKQTELIGYPVLPVVKQLVQLCQNGLGQYCHWGTTTQDITDTALILQIRDAFVLIEKELKRMIASLEKLAKKYKNTPMIGRSNLQQATPITFGYKVATWLSAFYRHHARLLQMRPRILVGEFGGASGTLATLGDQGLKVRTLMMEDLGLGEPSITFHTIRDNIAEAGCFLGLITGSLAKISMDIKLMMSTEVNEVSEPFLLGRGSSSTMPQKRNPISCNFIHACAASTKQLVAALLDAMVADHERSTGPWEIEWVVIPEMFSLTSGALNQANFILSGLEVKPENMIKNLNLTQGFVCAEAVMMALSEKIGREKAHDLIYNICHQPDAKTSHFFDLLKANQTVTQHLKPNEIKRLLNPKHYTGLAATMVEKILR